MPMTRASMDAQTRPAPAPTPTFTDLDGTGAGADAVAGFDPDSETQANAAPATDVKPAGPNWDHCDVANGSAASVTPGKVTPVAQPSNPFKSGSKTGFDPFK
jgi:hypothetical protein